jgi:hypothetical protein
MRLKSCLELLREISLNNTNPQNLLIQPPPPFGVLLLQKEERVNVLYFNSFPSFFKGGVAPDVYSQGTGWLVFNQSTNYLPICNQVVFSEDQPLQPRY